jgi:hypothetical protein
VEAVYAGCIPVLISDMTHYYYHNILDYSQFAIFIEEKDLENLESHLLAISNDKVRSTSGINCI